MGHVLVPEHTILTEKECKDLLEKYHIKPDQLPKILNTDSAVMSIGAKPGQIVKILRKSQTAKQAIAYRLVVEGESIVGSEVIPDISMDVVSESSEM